MVMTLISKNADKFSCERLIQNEDLYAIRHVFFGYSSALDMLASVSPQCLNVWEVCLVPASAVSCSNPVRPIGCFAAELSQA
jgi:hypothetical protein